MIVILNCTFIYYIRIKLFYDKRIIGFSLYLIWSIVHLATRKGLVMVMEDENSEYAGYAKLMIAPFDAADHSNASVKWAQWSSMFKLYIDSTGIKADVKKKALLLLHAGERAREIHEAIGKENDKYEDVIKAFTGYFKPVTNTDAERLKFREIRQGAQERFDTFLVRLRQASKAATLSEEDIKAQKKRYGKGVIF